jgi:hypothetical protein
MLASGLSWFWMSFWRSDLVIPKVGRPDLGLMRLTPASLRDFIDDVLQRDEDGDGKALACIALDSFDGDTIDDADWLRLQLDKFARLEAGAVTLIVVQPGDVLTDLVFAAHRPEGRTAAFLEGFDLGIDRVRKKLPYSRLRSFQLEGSTFDFIIKNGTTAEPKR